MTVLQSDAGAPDKKVVSRGRISTKSGEILILEPDGSVSEMTLDSPEGQDAFALTEADLAMLNNNLQLDLSGVPDMGPVRSRGLTAQEQALAEFRARTKPMKLNLPVSFTADPKDFEGAVVKTWSSKKKSGDSLVEVTANLRGGVDADTAFAYATCALANWAGANGTPYARHIRTLRDKRNGKMIVGSVFTLSEKKPLGLTVMTTKDTLQECKSRGIPAA
ncbi:hypothetical protein [Paracoccus aestuariivivens]|uniref:hypothetical protein n=1 Tax=Paracoccus aestuariivivens TaxID=1820333 RepID=UPI0031B62ECF